MNAPAPHPDLPDGYVARPLSLDDADGVSRLLNDYAQALTGENEVTAEELRLEWSSPGFVVGTDGLVVLAPDGRIVSYADYWDAMEPHVRPYSWCRVHPDHCGLGLGTHGLAWVDARSAKTLELAPSDARVGILNSVIQEDAPAHALLEGRGWTHVRSYYTMRVDFDGPPPMPALPEGITVRAFRAGEPLLDLAVAVDDCFSDHWGHVPSPVDELVKHWEHWVREDPKHDPSLWLLAEDAGRIAGMSICTLEAEGDPERGWCHTLGVRREYRRKGLGLALLSASLVDLHERGKKGVGLGVDATSLTGATKLYEKAGMAVARQSDHYEKVLREGRELMTRRLSG